MAQSPADSRPPWATCTASALRTLEEYEYTNLGPRPEVFSAGWSMS